MSEHEEGVPPGEEQQEQQEQQEQAAPASEPADDAPPAEEAAPGAEPAAEAAPGPAEQARARAAALAAQFAAQGAQFPVGSGHEHARHEDSDEPGGKRRFEDGDGDEPGAKRAAYDYGVSGSIVKGGSSGTPCVPRGKTTIPRVYSTAGQVTACPA